MVKDRGKKSKVKIVILVILLAVICIGAVELLACRQFEPELYARIMAPVHTALDHLAAAGEDIRTSAMELLERLKPEPEPEELTDLQLASEPALLVDLPDSDPITTELKLRDGEQILTGGAFEITYFNQSDETWADQPYGTDHIGGYGCGPTAMAMAVSSMTDQLVTPTEMAQWAVEHRHWARKGGSYLSIVIGAADAFGLKAQACHADTPDELRAQLSSSGMMVALMTAGHFTQSGHFILLRGVTLNGDILVADPNSVERSLVTWDPQLILDELSRSTAHGAPLWTLSLDLTKNNS